MTLALVLRNVKWRIEEITRKDRRVVLLVCVLVALIFIAAVATAIYNSMIMQSDIGVRS